MSKWLEMARLAAEYIKSARQDKAELIELLEKNNSKLSKTDQAKVKEIKERKNQDG